MTGGQGHDTHLLAEELLVVEHCSVCAQSSVSGAREGKSRANVHWARMHANLACFRLIGCTSTPHQTKDARHSLRACARCGLDLVLDDLVRMLGHSRGACDGYNAIRGAWSKLALGRHGDQGAGGCLDVGDGAPTLAEHGSNLMEQADMTSGSVLTAKTGHTKESGTTMVMVMSAAEGLNAGRPADGC